MEKNKEYARSHASPGPSHHLDPLPGRIVGLASGSDPLVSAIIDHVTVEASQKAILHSDDDLEDGGSPDRGGCSSAQPMSSYPDVMRAMRNTPEITGMVPHPFDEEAEG
eukprot:6169256-Pyramimonas_sp.AAC.1